MTSYIGLVALVIVVGACARVADKTAKPSAEADSTAIAKAFAEYVSVWKAADPACIASLYCDEAMILPGDHPAESGQPLIIRFDKDFFNNFAPGSFEVSSQETKIIGDWTFDRETYKFMAAPKEGGQPISDQGKYLVILQRQADDSWKWFRDLDNSDDPPAPSGPTNGR